MKTVLPDMDSMLLYNIFSFPLILPTHNHNVTLRIQITKQNLILHLLLEEEIVFAHYKTIKIK